MYYTSKIKTGSHLGIYSSGTRLLKEIIDVIAIHGSDWTIQTGFKRPKYTTRTVLDDGGSCRSLVWD